MTTEEKQDAFLKILGRMIGTMSIEPSSRIGANRSAADVFNELMDAAIAKAHEAMEESEKYAADPTDCPERDEFKEQWEKEESAIRQCIEFLPDDIWPLTVCGIRDNFTVAIRELFLAYVGINRSNMMEKLHSHQVLVKYGNYGGKHCTYNLADNWKK